MYFNIKVFKNINFYLFNLGSSATSCSACKAANYLKGNECVVSCPTGYLTNDNAPKTCTQVYFLLNLVQ
jgi:hypothetical protein